MKGPFLALAAGLGVAALAVATWGSVTSGGAESATLAEQSDSTVASQLADEAAPSPFPNEAYEIIQVLENIFEDPIPAIYDPQFLTASEAMDQFKPEELVVGVSINGEHRAYSIPQLSLHEIVNDEVGGVPIAVTWCPLCYSAMVFNREIEGQEFTFGVTGALIRNSLVMYDHETGSQWSQFLGRAMNWEMEGTELELVPSLLTTWEAWLELHPDTRAMDKEGRYSEDVYKSYYRIESAGVIGRKVKDERLTNKEFVVGVEVDGYTRAYSYSDLERTPVINDSIHGLPIVILLDAASGTSVVYNRQLDGRILTFSLGEQEEGLPFGIEDQETGTRWNALTGEATEGELFGAVLQRVEFLQVFWFAWVDFYSETEVYGQ